jgi:hypothetical protein
MANTLVPDATAQPDIKVPQHPLLPTKLAVDLPVAADVGQLPSAELIPTSGDDLTQLTQEQYNLDLNLAESLGYAVFTLQAGVKHDVLIFQAPRFKDIYSGVHTYRYGVAVEATIIATTAHLNVWATLAAVAANVQLTEDQLPSSGYQIAKRCVVLEGPDQTYPLGHDEHDFAPHPFATTPSGIPRFVRRGEEPRSRGLTGNPPGPGAACLPFVGCGGDQGMVDRARHHPLVAIDIAAVVRVQD